MNKLKFVCIWCGDIQTATVAFKVESFEIRTAIVGWSVVKPYSTLHNPPRPTSLELPDAAVWESGTNFLHCSSKFDVWPALVNCRFIRNAFFPISWSLKSPHFGYVVEDGSVSVHCYSATLMSYVSHDLFSCSIAKDENHTAIWSTIWEKLLEDVLIFSLVDVYLAY